MIACICGGIGELIFLMIVGASALFGFFGNRIVYGKRHSCCLGKSCKVK